MHGYRHPVLDDAVTRQLSKMSHVMFGGLTHRPASELCGKLVDLTPEPLAKVFLSDSGSVSVEVAMKMCLQYQRTVRGPATRKTKFLSLRNGYHGDTIGAMSVCDPVNGMHSLFAGSIPEQIFADGPGGPSAADAEACAEAVERALGERGDEIAALIFEPVVQGAGGMRFHHPILLRRMRDLADGHGALLIFDEIATGFGRTGTLFACEQDESTYRPWSSASEETPSDGAAGDATEGAAGAAGAAAGGSATDAAVVPDVLCLGKALTGGYMTLGATLATDAVAEGISADGGVFMHGPTFMGNPLATAAACASVDLLLDSPWKERVREVNGALIESLSPASRSASVREVRVLGAIGVVELREPVYDRMAEVQRSFVESGVWLRPFGKLLYTMPPFNCPRLERGHVERIGEAVCKVAESLA